MTNRRPLRLNRDARAITYGSLLHGFLVLVVFCFAWSALPVSAALAQGLVAQAVAERERDYGRLTLSFDDRLDLPAFVLEVENGVLRIEFEEPVETDIRDAMRSLSDFVTIARQDPDGMALRFGLSRAVRINTMEAGETLFIDFLPASWQGFPPPLPEEVVERLAQRAEQAAREAAETERRRLLGELEPEVELRVGRAPTFTRYNFDWTVPFNVAIAQEGSELSMRFDYNVPIDLNPALIDQAAELESIEAEQDGASLAISMRVAPGSRLRWFQDGSSFIVDLDREQTAQSNDDEANDIARALEALRPDGAADQDGIAFESVGARQDDVVRTEDPATASQSSTALGGDTSLEAQTDITNLLDNTGTPVVEPDERALVDQQGDAATPGFVSDARPLEVNAAASGDDTSDMVRVEVSRESDTTRLVFPFEEPTAAAIFRRASIVTLVFETPIPFDLRSLRAELRDQIVSITPMRRNALNVIHLELRQNSLVTAVPSGNRWIVALGPSILESPEPLQLGRGIFPDGKAFAELVHEGFSTAYQIVHPHVRDTLQVVPMMPPTRGALSAQSLVEFDVLSSAHGLVIQPKIDALSVQVDPSRVLISRDQGMTLSELGLSLGSFGFSPDERQGYFDLRGYFGDGAGSYERRFNEYQNQISMAEGPVRLERLMEFARFLLAFELGQEAVGVLDIVRSENTALEHDPSYLAVRAAALTLAGRFEEARDLARSHVMNGVEDIRFWALLSEAGLRNWEAVNSTFDEVSTLFDDYPSGLVTRARLAGAQAALEVQSIASADERLSQVDPRRASDDVRPYLDLLYARLDQAKGNTADALAVFDRLRAENAGPIGAQASLLSVSNRIATNDLSREEGLAQLENLAVAWRGDDTEIETRILLGDLYVEEDRYNDALLALKGVVVSQPDHRQADEIADQMQSVFVDLFLNGHADELPAIDALSLFYDFRELTPIGRQGDELVRRLADRLVEIDLLAQAADLLEHQVENRLTGAAKAQIAADLALIYLMDYRPGDAVQTLQRSRVSQVPMAIERVRRIIEARALSELGRHELALEMLRAVDGSDADAVRADVLWNAERWQEAGEAIERAMGQRWSDPVSLDDDEMQQVLRSAIAFAFASDAYALDRLRARYEPKMTDGVFASAFDVVTAPIETHGSAFRDVARSIAGLNTLNRFLDDYRSTFSSQAISGSFNEPGA